MAAGFKYDLTPDDELEERYAVITGKRRIGAFKLTTNLVSGTVLPSFAPIYADKVNKKAYPVINVKVAEAYTSGATSIKVEKNSLAYKEMILGSGKKGTTVSAIDKTNADYDVLTIDGLAEAETVGTVLFEATAAGGTTQKYIANSALYGKAIVGKDDLVALLRTAAEIEPSKLVVPFSDNDKAEMKGWFDFND